MGTLEELERLKTEYAPQFKAAAPKVKRIDVRCFRLRCSTAMNPKNLKSTARGLRVAKQTCTRKTCPREILDKYLELLERTRPFRQRNDDPESTAFWWATVGRWRDKLRRAIGKQNAA